jgi:chaperone BCS1
MPGFARLLIKGDHHAPFRFLFPPDTRNNHKPQKLATHSPYLDTAKQDFAYSTPEITATMTSTIFQGLTSALLRGDSSPFGAISHNPAFATAAAPAAQSALSSLALDLTGGRELTQLTSSMILTNILGMLKLNNRKVYTVIKVVVPCLILVAGIGQLVQSMSSITNMVKAAVTSVTDLVTASVVVPAGSSLNGDVLAWLASQNLGKNPRALTLATRDNEHDFDDEDDVEPNNDPLKFIPSFGQTKFTYAGHRMTLVRSERTGEVQDGKFVKFAAGESDPTKSQNFTLTCFPTFRGTEPIQEFLKHVRHFSKPKAQAAHTSIMRAMTRPSNRFGWDQTWRRSRAIEGVVMEAATKTPLIADIEYYLSQECRNFYENRGIPYHRGYLLYGPPGTGKTSFAVAMAGHFKLPIYVFSLSDTEMSDAQLSSLFDDLVHRCVLLLEDVDSAGLNRESMSAAADGTKVTKKGVTLSGLLNCLDGPCSVDGRLLCMTSNSPDSLDPALVRPGRCDRKILFGYTCPEVSAEMFKQIYTKSSAKLYAGEVDHASVHDLPELATSFANSIPVGAQITPAECQAYLLANRVDPLAAVNGSAAWAAEIIETKLRGANVAKFSNEISKSAEVADTKASPAQASPAEGSSTVEISSTQSSSTVASFTTANSNAAPPPSPSSLEGSSEKDGAALLGADDSDDFNDSDDSDDSDEDADPRRKFLATIARKMSRVTYSMSESDRENVAAELEATECDFKKLLAFGEKYGIDFIGLQ